MEKKHRDKFEKSELTAAENQSTGQFRINISLYGKCHKCQNWIIRKQLPTHDSFHAAEIFPNLFLGDKFSCRSEKELFSRLKVTHILNAATEISNYFQDRGISYCQLDLMDNMSEDVIEPCLKAAAFIDQSIKQGGKVFVHCAMGKSRSVSAILMYMMKYLGIPLEQSLEKVRETRSMAKPNLNYMEQLKKFEASNPNLFKAPLKKNTNNDEN